MVDLLAAGPIASEGHPPPQDVEQKRMACGCAEWGVAAQACRHTMASGGALARQR